MVRETLLSKLKVSQSEHCSQFCLEILRHQKNFLTTFIANFVSLIITFTICGKKEKILKSKICTSFFVNVGTPSGIHLFDHLLWSIFQSSIEH